MALKDDLSTNELQPSVNTLELVTGYLRVTSTRLHELHCDQLAGQVSDAQRILINVLGQLKQALASVEDG